jgi:hypothetical protein
MNSKKIIIVLVVIMATAAFTSAAENKKNPGARYPVVDTGQDRCYSNTGELVYPRRQEPFYGQDAQYVGRSPSYRDNGNGTVTDLNTGLMWQKTPDFVKRALSEAESYADSLSLAGYNDWRLPNVKELQSIVDYNRAPDASNPANRSPAIDPVFLLTEPESWFWTGTTHIENGFGYYVCFGQAFSAWIRQGKKMNAHGAGAVRSDPKTGNPSQWPNGLGPQGDEIRIYNYVRCVRGGDVKTRTSGPSININRPTRNRIKVNNNRNRGPGQPGQSRGKGFVKRLDKDGDGKVSKKEFDGPKHHFDKLDRNGDGFLSEDESPPPRRSRNRKRFPRSGR